MYQELKNHIKRKLVKRDVYVEQLKVSSSDLLKDRIALVTGGGSGIGYGIASSIVNSGGKVVLTGRNQGILVEACTAINSDKGDESARYLIWDHSKAELVDSLFGEAVDKFGRIDILINNAGYHGNQNFFTISESDFDQTFDTNVKQIFFLSQKTAAYMKENRIHGNILNISSAASWKPAWSPYEISKWACRGFTRGLARELAPYHIIVNGIAPGPSATRMSHWEDGDSLSWEGIPAGRMVLPEEVGNLAVFLVSDMGRSIMGETVFCDGGSGMLTI